MTSKLYTPLQVGPTTVANRIFMAPLTRGRADNVKHMPNAVIAEHYTQRATAGLVIAECTMVSEGASAFYTEPGIYNDEQAEAWKLTTEGVHKAGGKIFLQIWHGGRACPAEYNGGNAPVAPSAVPIPHRYASRLNGELRVADTPRALTDEEAQAIVKDFASAAKRAIAAGFDGIELHGANGYLINQFLVPQANQRGPESRYSGENIETRARFMLDVVDACAAEIGADRVGIRLSPLVTYNAAFWENLERDVAYVSSELEKRNIVYIHVERRDLVQPEDRRDITALFKQHYTGLIISNTQFDREESEKYIDEGKADAIALGVPFMFNPDIVRRYKEQRPERNPQPENPLAAAYGEGAKDYNDHPFLE